MASVKFSSAVLLLVFVSSILSVVVGKDSDVIVNVRGNELRMSAPKDAVIGEASVEHTIFVKHQDEIAERSVTCPKVRDGVYKPAGISSCSVVQEEITRTRYGYEGDFLCFDYSELFTGAQSIDSVNIRARECNGVGRTQCKDVPLRKYQDFFSELGNGLCVNVNAEQVCHKSKTPNCVRYYQVSVANAGSNIDLTKAEGACSSASTYLAVASEKSALKGLEGRCLPTYRCDFEPLNLDCTYARCTFEPQDFPIYVHGSNVEMGPTKRYIDHEMLEEDECYKIRVPSNQGSAALDLNNPATCGVHHYEDYKVWVTANICNREVLYKQIVDVLPAQEGQFCNSDSHCAAGTECDKSVKPFVCKATATPLPPLPPVIIEVPPAPIQANI